MSVLAAAWRTLRNESVRSAWERTADRLADLRRERSFVRVPLARFSGGSPILNLVPFPLRRLWGGTALQMLARLEVEEGNRPIGVAMPAANGWRIESTANGLRRSARVPARWVPDQEALIDEGFEDTVLRLAEVTGSGLVHFESAARLPLTSLSRLRQAGVRWLLSVQDFALVTPYPHHIEGSDVAPPNGARNDAAVAVLGAAEAVIFPSAYLCDEHARLFPQASIRRVEIIPPALSLPAASGPRQEPIRHVAFVGALQRHKGAHLLPEIAARLAGAGPGRPSRFSVFGAGDPEISGALRRLGSVTLHGWYRAGSLPQRLGRESVDLALLLSITPESHGLALDECLSAGVPALVFAHGALAERISGMRCGLAVPLASGAESVATAVAGLVASGRPLEIAPELWRIGTPDQTAAAHRELYASLAAPPG